MKDDAPPFPTVRPRALSADRARRAAQARWGGRATDISLFEAGLAYHASTPGHGGLLVDARDIDVSLRAVFDPLLFMPPVQLGDGAVYAFEEDADWVLPVLFGGLASLEFENVDGLRRIWRRYFVERFDALELDIRPTFPG